LCDLAAATRAHRRRPDRALAVPQPIWNVANSSMRDFFLEKLVAPLAASPEIDGVFYDCFNYAYDMPTPWGRRATNIPNCTSAGGSGCEALLSGTLDLARRIALALNAGGKVPMFSNAASFANPTRAPIWLDEQRLVDALSGTQYLFNYEFFRAEQAASSFELPNLLQESALGIPVGMHTRVPHASTRTLRARASAAPAALTESACPPLQVSEQPHGGPHAPPRGVHGVPARAVV
jgi:hypothetical protein